MSIRFIMTRDVNGYNGFGLPFSQDTWGGFFAPNAEQHFTVPENSQNWIALFSYSGGISIWVSVGQTVVLPSSTFGPVNCELNPQGLQVKGGDLISIITNDGTLPWVGVALYTLS